MEKEADLKEEASKEKLKKCGRAEKERSPRAVYDSVYVPKTKKERRWRKNWRCLSPPIWKALLESWQGPIFLEYTKKFQGERFLPLSYRLLGCWMMAHVVAQQGAQNNMNLGKQKMTFIEKLPLVSVDTQVIKYARPKVKLWTKNRIFLCS